MEFLKKTRRFTGGLVITQLSTVLVSTRAIKPPFTLLTDTHPTHKNMSQSIPSNK